MDITTDTPTSSPPLLPPKIHHRILSYLDPYTLNRVATLVCKPWHTFIRSRPRIVLLNLRVIITDKDPNAPTGFQPLNVCDVSLPPLQHHFPLPEPPKTTTNDKPQAYFKTGCKKCVSNVRLSHPTPLESFCRVPERYHDRLGGFQYAGEGLVVTTTWDMAPDSCKSLCAFLQTLHSIVSKWLPTTTPRNRTNNTNTALQQGGGKDLLALIPWEIQLTPAGRSRLETPVELERLGRVFGVYSPRVVKYAFPPPILMHLLPMDVELLQVFSCRQFIAPLDFSALEKLKRPEDDSEDMEGVESSCSATRECAVRKPFGVNLRKLVLNAQMQEEEVESEGAVEPEEMAPLSYENFLPTLQSLHNLTFLSIRGLDQTTLSPFQLVSTLLSLPKLQVLDSLINTTETFWTTLYANLPSTLLPLRCLTLSFDEEEPSLSLFQNTMTAILRCLPNLRSVRFFVLKSAAAVSPSGVNTVGQEKLTPTGILNTLRTMRQAQGVGVMPVTRLKRVTVKGLEGGVSLEDLGKVGVWNLEGGVSLSLMA
ncbi:hypothetical protein HDV05_008029 [Chytridiales sp. JEL 0842]|nr:hypothetical protein HDV05_008029 [Chytridiales sp. JEL 0842]